MTHPNAATLAAPDIPSKPLSFIRYGLAMNESLIAGFDAGAFNEDVVERKFLWFHHFLVNHPDGIKRVLLDNVRNYVKARTVRPLVVPALGNGLVTSEGDTWRWHRRIMAPPFTSSSIAEYAPTMTSAVDSMLREWDALDSGAILELDKSMMALMLEIISRTMFSSDSNMIKGVLERSSREYQNEMTLSPLALIPGINKVWASYKRRRAAHILSNLNATIYSLIGERRQDRRGPRQPDLLDRLMSARDAETGQQLSDTDIRDQVVTIFVAGHETTALALTWAWYLLAKQPAEEAKFHAEIDEALRGRQASYADAQNLPFVKMVLEEALRLYPPVHSLAWREAVASDEICGRHIPAGALVAVVPWVVHRHQALWDEPDRFEPERFCRERSNKRPRYAYIPFSGGPRVCIGAAFAMIEGVLALAQIGQRYRFRLVEEHRVEPRGLLTLHPKNGLNVCLVPRYPSNQAAGRSARHDTPRDQ